MAFKPVLVVKVVEGTGDPKIVRVPDWREVVPRWALDCWQGIEEAHDRVVRARRELGDLAQRLERDLGLHITFSITTGDMPAAEVSRSLIDVLADKATPDGDKVRWAAALVTHRWPGRMDDEVRAAREAAVLRVADRMHEPHARLRVNGRDWLVGEPDKRASRLPPDVRVRWFWSEVEATLRGDRPRTASGAVATTVAASGRTRLSPRRPAAPTNRRRRSR